MAKKRVYVNFLGEYNEYIHEVEELNKESLQFNKISFTQFCRFTREWYGMKEKQKFKYVWVENG